MQKLRVLGYGLTFLILTNVSCALSPAMFPQNQLPQQKISFCGHNYLAWVAKTDEDRTRGLMNFRTLRPHEAMIFIFDDERPLNFWMKNVQYDLDIAYFSAKKKLITSMTMKGTSPMMKDESLPTYKSEKPSKYSVEVTAGTLKNLPKNCVLTLN